MTGSVDRLVPSLSKRLPMRVSWMTEQGRPLTSLSACLTLTARQLTCRYYHFLSVVEKGEGCRVGIPQ